MKVCDTYVITTKGAKGTYTSDNSSVVAVNKKNGKLVAKKAGKAVITVDLKCIKRKVYSNSKRRCISLWLQNCIKQSSKENQPL